MSIVLLYTWCDKIHRNDYSALCDVKEDIFGVAALWNRRPWPAAMM